VIVADTNLVVYVLLRGDHSDAALAVRARDRQWVVPALFRYELMSVLTKYVVRGVLQRDAALRLYRRGLSLVHVVDFEPDAPSIFNWCVGSGCSSYDVEFIALAMHLGISLITADKQVIGAFPDVTTDLTRATNNP
jgi:predicted nucleic acid-binding protein